MFLKPQDPRINALFLVPSPSGGAVLIRSLCY
jgi:hypothetical protein